MKLTASKLSFHNAWWRVKWTWLFVKRGQFPQFFEKPFWFHCELGWFRCPDFWAPAVLAPGYEPAVEKKVKELRDGLFVDVGANVGRYTVAAAKNGNRVIAIEPSPETFTCLSETIAANNLNHLVKLVNAAAWSKDGSVNFKGATSSTVSHA